MANSKYTLKGNGFEELEQTILGLDSANWNPKNPLPPTRLLAESFHTSHTKVYRFLLNLVGEGKLVAHEVNGRFYLKGSEAFATKNLPVACLFRNLENWFMVAKGQLTGISRVCESLGRGVVLFRHGNLVQHPSVEYPPLFGSASDQIKGLQVFFDKHFSTCSGVIFEDLWLDEALEHFSTQLHRAVVVGRQTKIKNLKCIYLDCDSAAYQALAHLHGRGFKKIVLAIPFQGNEEVDRQMEALRRASQKLGLPISEEAFKMATTPEERTKLIACLKSGSERVAIFCPEDNVSTLLYQEIQKQGVSCPDKVGLLSGMGEAGVLGLQISSIHYDYIQMGSLAVTKLFEKNVKTHEAVTPNFIQGIST